ncbi:hypothetical protein OX89_01545 [Diaphorobacter sp. J5-51]|nr:hypothetical protein OX89_01545 [Diaphorobacter sp. J5-51]
MADFLASHNRYNTMNSWNGNSSYANCVKVNRLGINGTSLEKAFEILASDYWDEIRFPIREFEKSWYGGYTIGSNGRSGGYLVLYEAEVYSPGHRSTCTRCGQLNFQQAVEGSVCGVCRAPRVNLKSPLKWVRAKSSSIDHRMSKEDYLDMSHAWLKDRAELVRSFDAACDQVRNAFIELINDFMVVEETVMVPQKVKRLERI